MFLRQSENPKGDQIDDQVTSNIRTFCEGKFGGRIFEESRDGVITFFPAKIPAKLGGLTAPLPHHSAKKPSLSTHLERTWLQIAPSLLLSNRTACFIQPRPRAPWRLSGEKCTRKCYDPNKQHRRSIPFTLSSRSPSGSAKVPKIHRRSFVIRARRQDG